MNTQVSPPPTPDAAAQAAAWEATRTTLAGGDQTRAQLLQGFASPDALFERITAEPVKAEPTWADAQKLLAGEDPDALAFVGKYADGNQAFKAWKSAVAKMSEGGVKLPGANATPEEIAAYNAAIGLPESADKFEITAKPPQGYEPSDADKASLAGITKRLHEAAQKGPLTPQTVANLATEIYYEQAADSIVQAENRAAEAAAEGEAINRRLWGPNYEKNIGWAIAGAKQFFPGNDQQFDELMGLKLESGHALFDHPVLQQMFAQLGMEHAEDPFFLASKERNSGFDPAKRYAEIQAMRTGTGAQQKEYQRLSAPGGELEKLIEGMNRDKARKTG